MTVVNTNLPALNAQRNLGITSFNLSRSIARLSSGLRINSAADDAAGLSISEKLNSQVRGLNQAVRNSQDSISLIQTAEGALGEMENILQRMRELSVQAANDTLTSTDRTAISTEVTQLTSALTKISGQTKFNTISLLGGTLGYSFSTAIATAATGISSFSVSDSSAFNDYLTRKIAGGTAGAVGTFTVTISSGTLWSAGNNVARVTLSDSTGKYVEVMDQVAVPSAASDSKQVTFSTFGLTLTINSSIFSAAGALSASVSGTLLTLQVGANAGETYTNVSVSNFTPGSGKFTATSVLNLSSSANASSAMTYLDAMIASVSSQRAQLGASHNTRELLVN